MMMRSVPPASAHFAESPVPAPAPMMTPPVVERAAQPRARLVPCHPLVSSM